MTKRRLVIGLIILAAAALAAVMLMKTLGPKPGEDSEEAATDVAVHVGKIIRTTLYRYVTAYGTVEPEPAMAGKPAAGAFLSSPVGGILAEVRCVEGQPVELGAVLFRLDTRVADVAVLKAKKQLEFAEQTFERQKKLLAADGTSQKSYQEAEQSLAAARDDLAAAQTELSLFEIRAPIAGTLVRLVARLGQPVETNTVLAEVIALDRLVVTAQVPSREALALKPGQPVNFGPDSVASGTLALVGKDIDPRTDTVVVRVSLPPGAGILPGQFLNIRIAAEERRERLAVPIESLVTENGRSEIAVIEGDRAAKRPVTAGLRDRGLVEVDGEGLKEGMTVVTVGAYGLPKESRIRIVGR
jgi:membrane fusion protein (multidrug efflux system)